MKKVFAIWYLPQESGQDTLYIIDLDNGQLLETREFGWQYEGGLFNYFKEDSEIYKLLWQGYSEETFRQLTSLLLKDQYDCVNICVLK